MVDRLLKQRGCISGSHSCVFYNTVLFFPFSKTWMWTSVEHMRDNWVLNPSPVSRSSASSRYCSGGIRLSAHHFRYLQLPHLQVRLIASSCCFLSVLLLTQTLEIWVSGESDFFFFLLLSKKESKKKRERNMFEAGLMGCASIGASVVFTQLLPWQQLSRWWC